MPTLAALQHFETHGGVSLVAVPLQQTHDGDLASHRSALRDTTALTNVAVHVAGFATDVGLVHLNVAVDSAAVLGLQREPQARQHEPRGLLGDVEGAAEFVAGDAVLAVDEQPKRGKPLLERQRAVFEDGAHFERELGAGMVPVALPDRRVVQVLDLRRAGTGALDDAIRPADRDHCVVAIQRVREPNDGFLQGLGLEGATAAGSAGRRPRRQCKGDFGYSNHEILKRTDVACRFKPSGSGAKLKTSCRSVCTTHGYTRERETRADNTERSGCDARM